MGLDIRLQHEDILSPCIGFNYVSGRTARGAAAFCAVSAKEKARLLYARYAVFNYGAKRCLILKK